MNIPFSCQVGMQSCSGVGTNVHRRLLLQSLLIVAGVSTPIDTHNVNSGVGIIIGKRGVLPFMCPRDNRVCYRNSSFEMEMDIILEGFLEADRVHGVCYMEFVSDGDSSVYPTLLQNVPGWAHAVKKLKVCQPCM